MNPIESKNNLKVASKPDRMLYLFFLKSEPKNSAFKKIRMKKNYAVITGASTGLGRAFAETLAKENHSLLLISLPDEGLTKLCEDLEERFEISVECFETDLSKRENVLQAVQWINENYSIDILINNVGIGGSQRFEEAEIEYLEKMIDINITATTLLTHELLPNLKAREKAHILNVSSLAGLSPIPYKTIYPASKAFIHSFSRGLNEELKNTSVSVSVVNPGPMKTNGNTTKRINRHGFLSRITLREPEEIASYSIRKMKSGKSLIVTNWLSWIVLKLTPTWISLPILGRKFKSEVDKA